MTSLVNAAIAGIGNTSPKTAFPTSNAIAAARDVSFPRNLQNWEMTGANLDWVQSDVIEILAKYGTDAHVYLPGIGVINGLTAGNYLDSAGTTAATVDNPVGLVLDAANSVIGAEKTVNGDFSDGTTTGAGVAGTGYSSTLSNVSNKLRVTKTQAIGMAVIGTTGTPLYIPTTVGSTYKMTVSTGDKTGAGGFDIRIGTAPESASYYRNNTITANQSVTFYVVATTATMFISLMSAGGASGDYNDWDNISVKEVTGIHATQGTTANKPILRLAAGKYSWQFDGTDYLSLGSVPFQMADDHCIVTGFKATANATNKTIFSQTETGSSQAPWLRVSTANKLSITYVASGFTAVTRTSVADVVTSPFVASVNMVSKIGRMRINAVDEGATFDISTITFPSSAVSSIGSFNNSSLFFVGSLCPQIYIKGTVSDVDLLILEKFVGQLSGVTI